MEFLISLAVASMLGFLAGLGVGGGSLLVLYLTLVLDWSQRDARTLNLLFFLPGAIIATLMRRKKEDLPLKPLLLPIAAGCIAAILGSMLAKGLDTDLLRKLFGALLLAVGIKELLYKKNPSS